MTRDSLDIVSEILEERHNKGLGDGLNENECVYCSKKCVGPRKVIRGIDIHNECYETIPKGDVRSTIYTEPLQYLIRELETYKG